MILKSFLGRNKLFGLEIFANDKYKLLKWIAENEIEFKKEKYLPASQQEIAETMHYSKSKTNKYLNELIKFKFLKRYKKNGKYSVTDQGYKAIAIIGKMEENKNE